MTVSLWPTQPCIAVTPDSECAKDTSTAAEHAQNARERTFESKPTAPGYTRPWDVNNLGKRYNSEDSSLRDLTLKTVMGVSAQKGLTIPERPEGVKWDWHGPKIWVGKWDLIHWDWDFCTGNGTQNIKCSGNGNFVLTH